jgi:hypothetical protein
LERAIDLGNVGPLILLTGYQTPAALRRTGVKRLETWLRNLKVRSPEALAEAALDAAERQHTAIPGEKVIAQVIHTLAKEVISCDASRRFYERKRAEGKRHTQAVLALARRRVNVLWALIRDGRCYHGNLPATATA